MHVEFSINKYFLMTYKAHAYHASDHFSTIINNIIIVTFSRLSITEMMECLSTAVKVYKHELNNFNGLIIISVCMCTFPFMPRSCILLEATGS